MFYVDPRSPTRRIKIKISRHGTDDRRPIVKITVVIPSLQSLCSTLHMMMVVLIFVPLFQDLQSEIETHRDVYASLTGTGRRLLGSLSSQEDAVMLQRRLDEMNQRWHHLKAKSMAIRWVTC